MNEPTGVTFGAAAARAFEAEDRRRRAELDALIAAGLGDKPRRAAPGASQAPTPAPPPAQPVRAPPRARQAPSRTPRRLAQRSPVASIQALTERAVRQVMDACARELRRRAKG